MTTTTTTVTFDLFTVDDTAAIEATVKAVLVCDITGQVPGFDAGDGTEILPGPYTATTDDSGHAALQLVPNSLITPSGSYWQINEPGAQRRIVVPTGGGPIAAGACEQVVDPTPPGWVPVVGPAGPAGPTGPTGGGGTDVIDATLFADGPPPEWIWDLHGSSAADTYFLRPLTTTGDVVLLLRPPQPSTTPQTWEVLLPPYTGGAAGGPYLTNDAVNGGATVNWGDAGPPLPSTDQHLVRFIGDGTPDTYSAEVISDPDLSTYALAAALATETDRAESAEAANAGDIAAEQTRAESAEAANATDITTEQTRALAAEDTLRASIPARGSAGLTNGATSWQLGGCGIATIGGFAFVVLDCADGAAEIGDKSIGTEIGIIDNPAAYPGINNYLPGKQRLASGEWLDCMFAFISAAGDTDITIGDGHPAGSIVVLQGATGGVGLDPTVKNVKLSGWYGVVS